MQGPVSLLEAQQPCCMPSILAPEFMPRPDIHVIDLVTTLEAWQPYRRVGDHAIGLVTLLDAC